MISQYEFVLSPGKGKGGRFQIQLPESPGKISAGGMGEKPLSVQKNFRDVAVVADDQRQVFQIVLQGKRKDSVPEFGAAVRPMVMEAELLSELDLMDSRIYEMKEGLSSAGEDAFTG